MPSPRWISHAIRCGVLIPASVLVGSLVWGSPAFAQVHSCGVEGRPAKAQPPLFPKHRRGIYRNSQQIEVIDPTPQSPPLELDDPSVPDEGEFEINLLSAADMSRDARHIDLFRIDANYGLVLCGAGHALPTQLKIEVPWSGAREDAAVYRFGVGTSAIGLKFNFYNDENRGVRVALYPQAELSLRSGVEKGVAEDGQTFVLPLLVAKEFGFGTAVVNAGIHVPVHARDGVRTTDVGVGFGSAFFRKLAVMGDVRSSSTFDFKQHRLVAVEVGAMYGVRHAIWYAGTGHSLFSDDGPHTFVSFGMKVLVDRTP